MVTSLLLSIALKYIFEFLFYVIPVKGGSSPIYLIFVGIFFLLSSFFEVLSKFYFPQNNEFTLGTFFASSDTTHIGKKHVNLSSNADNQGPTNSGNSSSANKDISPILPFQERKKLLEDMSHNRDIIRKTIYRMWELKTTHNLKYCLDKEGNLLLDAPSDTSDQQLERLFKEVGGNE